MAQSKTQLERQALRLGDQTGGAQQHSKEATHDRPVDLKACEEWRRFTNFLKDVYVMSACDGLVGKFTSNFDRLVLALMAARRGSTPCAIGGSCIRTLTICRRAVVAMEPHLGSDKTRRRPPS